ncbi:VWA domain-containing protein [Notoacmeibacter sp. MSK16QG-6]|uniref:VWA domain-containing protein n=1 Tax=Notoacmeibacter sp. MSK16QG-6 TaxID=2957982 RepID=UPI00209CC4F2|nr:VWA domain-containing protein [Notoacmeibacter sp. MSK16QG-6]MCP1199220.1 VWA domain-containing protein [Notoacmeibacter sp. MSK16QG-6]
MLRNLRLTVRHFLRHKRGNYGMMAALLTVPLLIAVTVPIDTVRALGVRTVVQQASDAAALAAATSGLSSKAKRSALADSVFQANLDAAKLDLNISSAGLTESSSSGGSNPDTYTYSVVATVGDGATILPIGTLFSADIDAVVKTGNQMLDIALVLDNSGSMGSYDGKSTTRLTELKTAANTFIDQFAGDSQVKIGLVPFDSQVRVNLTPSQSGTATNPYAEIDCSTLTDPDELTICQNNQTTTTTTTTITIPGVFTMDCTQMPYDLEDTWCAAGKSGFTFSGTTGSTGTYVYATNYRVGCWGFCAYYETYVARYTAVYESDRYKIKRELGSCDLSWNPSVGATSPCATTYTSWGKTYSIFGSSTTIFDQAAPAGTTQTVTNTVTAYTYTPQSDKSDSDTTRTADSSLIWDGTSSYDGCYIDRLKEDASGNALDYDVTGYVMPVNNQDTQYTKAQCANNSLSYITGLTNQHDTIKTQVNGMASAGYTNITIGVAWGMEALSQNPPLTGARGASAARKIMVLMTDGENTQNRWTNVYVKSGSNWIVDTAKRTAINARTKLACDNAKAQGVEIYTINLVDGDSSLLSYCADSGAQALNAVRGGLESAFKNIATQIKRTYLAG